MDQNTQNYWQPGDEQTVEQNTAEPTPTAVGPADNNSQPQVQKDTSNKPEVEWHASEYIHHEKGTMWFVVLGIVTLVSAVIAVFLQQWIFAILVVVMGVALGVFATRPPREISYRISPEGITIGEQTFTFNQFKSFGVLNEGAFYSVQLRPSKRFMPGVSIYFGQEDGERIFDVLAIHLPMEEAKPDPVDKLMRWLRF